MVRWMMIVREFLEEHGRVDGEDPWVCEHGCVMGAAAQACGALDCISRSKRNDAAESNGPGGLCRKMFLMKFAFECMCRYVLNVECVRV